jgi:type VI secretion system protein ImpK
MTDKPYTAPAPDEDRTILRPTPGGRRRQAPPTATSMGQGMPAGDLPGNIVAGANPLVELALSLLSLVPQLRDMAACADIDALQARIADALKKYDIQMQQQNFSQAQSRTATYFLCTLLDETVLNTPWGSASNWGHNSLLIQFHGEAWGGEKFFDIVSHLAQQPARNLALIELAYLCLSLGFEGKYRRINNGLRQLEGLRQELYLVIQRQKNQGEPELSPAWRGLAGIRNPITRQLPPWVLALVGGALLMFVYLGFAYAINRSSNKVFDRLAAIAQEEARLPAEQPAPPPRPEIMSRADRFKKLLAPEISANMVEVVDGNLLRILSGFPSGSAQLKEQYRAMMKKIAQELDLNDKTSRIDVVGHSDATPIFTARFPSNWHLSQARAKNVADILAASAPLQERTSFDGRGAMEPIASNDTEEDRARNRRIDIRIR